MLKILVVDEDIHYLQIANKRLMSRGFEVQLCSSTEDSIKHLEKTTFDSVLANFSSLKGNKKLSEYIDNMNIKPQILNMF